MSPATSHASSCPCGQQGLHQTLATEGRTTVARHGQDHSRGGGRSGRGVPSCLCLRPLLRGWGKRGSLRIPFGAVVPWAFNDRPDAPKFGPRDRIRTCMDLVPNQVGYRITLHTDGGPDGTCTRNHPLMRRPLVD